MNTPLPSSPAPESRCQLAAFHALCEESLDLAGRESRALAAGQNYNPLEFTTLRKGLLPRLESALMQLRKDRQSQRQIIQSEETANLFETIQSLLMKFLQLDRENQQTLLRCRVVPAEHLPAVAAQQPHFVAGLYRQHARFTTDGPLRGG